MHRAPTNAPGLLAELLFPRDAAQKA